MFRENSPLSSEEPARKAAQQGSETDSGQHLQAAATIKHYLVRNQTQEPQSFIAAAKMSADGWGVKLKRFQLLSKMFTPVVDF